MFIPEVTDIEMILASGNDSETLIASFAFPPISSGLGKTFHIRCFLDMPGTIGCGE